MNCRNYCETCLRGSRSTLQGTRNSRAKGRPGVSKGGDRLGAFHSAGMLRASLPQEPEAVLPVEALPRAQPSAPPASEGTA